MKSAQAAFEPTRFGDYLLTAHLGRGGMADVFRAQRVGAAGFERTVVVKRILTTHHEDPTFVDMFVNEAKIAARLCHPNIAQVYELGSVNDEFFIVMEYVEGKDLLRVLRALARSRPERPSLPPLVAAYIAREVCRGLQDAHEHLDANGLPTPIIHRDVSPQNVMLSFGGQVKLVDFGIAKAIDTVREETRTGALKGKFAYMSPEQVQGLPPSPASDLFSTGVVLHEMLTGRRLFKGDTDLETLERVRSMPVPAPSSLSEEISPELDQIVLQALERDRDGRYATAQTMARDLDLHLQASRFSLEDMRDFMNRLFPVEEREEAAGRAFLAGSLAPGNLGSRPSRFGPSSRPSSLSDVPALPALRRSRSARRRTPFVVAGLGLTLACATAIWWPRAMRRPSAVMGPKPESSPISENATRSPEHPAMVPSMVRVELSSEPSGTRVFQGPRLLGQTPLSVVLHPSEAATVTLIHAGYADLVYTIHDADAPALTLRLSPRSHRRHASTAHAPSRQAGAAPSSAKLKIEVFDDESAPEKKPQVAPIDE